MKPKIPPRHLPVLIATSAIPALRLLSGLLMWLLGDSVLSSAYVMSYFVLPALTLAVLPPIICQNEDRSDRVIFTTIVLAGFFIMTMIFRYEGRFPTYAAYSGQEGLSRYESYVGTYVDPLPEWKTWDSPPMWNSTISPAAPPRSWVPTAAPSSAPTPLRTTPP